MSKYKDTGDDWNEFSKRLKRILRDAMRLRGRKKDVEAKRLAKRLRRHRKELLVFLYHDGVPYDNNHAERTIRNGVVMRKNSYCNRSLDGAKPHGVILTIAWFL